MQPPTPAEGPSPERWAPGSTLRRALWLAPPLFAIHNAEEGVAMARWTARELPGLLARARDALPADALPPPLANVLYGFEPPGAAQFWWSAALATAVPLLVYWLAATRGPRSGWTTAAIWLQAMFLLNVFVPHLAVTLWLRRYTPGVVTALAVNLPLSLYFFRGALREGVVSRRSLALFALAAVLSYGALLAALWVAGRVLAGMVGG